MRRPGALATLAGLLLLAVPATAQERELPRSEALEAIELPGEEGTPRLSADGLGEKEGPVVAAIELRTDVVPDRRQELASYLSLEVGERLTEDAVRRTVKNLYASGFAARVSLSTRPVAADRVEVIVALWSNIVVEAVELAGEFGVLERRELEEVLVQRPAEPLIESRVIRGDFRLEELLAERGYRRARVGLRVDVDEARRRARVTYVVEPGPRARIDEIAFRGDLGPFTPEALRDALRLEVGDAYRQRSVQESAERLQGWLIEQGYRAAAVTAPEETFSAEAPDVRLTYPVEVGPEVVVEVRGADVERLRRRDLLPFLGEGGYDEALVLQAVDRIRTHLQRQGHYRAEVSYREERSPGRLRIVLTVDRGPVYTLEAVRFEGNEQVSDAELAALAETSSARLLGLGAGRLVSEVLAADLANIRAYYALHGFAGTRVGPERVDIEERKIVLTIPVEEGTQRTIGAIGLEGVEALAAGRLRQRLAVREGGPFHPRLLEQSLDAVRALYDQEGYVGTQVSARQSWNEARTRVEITLRVLESPRQVLDRVIVRGNRRTDADVVRRALGLEPGDPVSGPGLLELERNLYRLGIFSDVAIELTPADLGTTRRDVVVRLEEGRVRSLNYGLGYDSDDGARGLAGFTHRNVGGRAYTFTTDLRLSEREERFRLLFDQPYIVGWPYRMLYELFRFEEDRESFRAVRWVARSEAIKRFGDLRLSLAYDFRLIEPDEFRSALLADPDGDGRLLPGIASPLELEDGRVEAVQVSSLIPALRLDRLDDPVDPRRGYSATAQLQYAFPLGEAEAHFAELFVDGSHYLDLGRGGVVASSLRLGLIEPLEGVAGTAGDKLLAIPIDERFFAGGGTTHRAFERFELGLPGETVLRAPPDVLPLGGTGLALVNLEYRFPLVASLGGTAFVDAGNVWRDWQDFEPGEMRLGAGVGLRYLSPIGPLRLDVGWKLDREGPEDPFEIHFTFGNPF